MHDQHDRPTWAPLLVRAAPKPAVEAQGDRWTICEHCGRPIDPEEANECLGCGSEFHPECIDQHQEECG